MWDKLFLHHPRGLGESYTLHLKEATVIAGSLLMAALACLIHAIVPHLFQSTASTIIRRLHGNVQRRRPPADSRALGSEVYPNYQI